ncbi:aminotransferase class V-fold PLP-dependent enzyme [Sphingobacterium paucimobilis]|uniref:Aminotransferase class V domain-containing protein n=1 Tax=Sphingobacterium paucimobilis HER1398 TaxID=1346330 RepID=U2HGC1_9SPHI|nr:aminotransferase class V-fold PLP-dependent enzyme [Sphingobacterium paucimobilis]ERJ60806.1 hypothetical protein M472_18800 [Sphingobacterium paucimobilis HER1398]
MDYKSYFDIPKGLTYLNTPGNGLMPIKHHKWRREWEQAFFDPDGSLRDQQVAFIKGIKSEISTLFNCPVTNVYAVPNFSFGFNVLLEGLPRESTFLLVEDDYPSLNYPVISRGYRYDIVAIGDGLLEANIRDALKQEKTDVLILSIVQYISGLKIDLDFIKELKRDFPDLILIGDATQYLGTEPFDFMESGFDAVCGSGYKWMIAGFGNGYVMLSDRLKEVLYADAQKRERPKELMWEHKSILETFFEPGHQDVLSQGTLLQSVLFFNEIGLSNVKRHLDDVVTYAYERFIDRNWILPIVECRSCRSGLINLQVPQDCYPLLQEEGIKCFPRGKGIRIGIHLYNNKEDIDRVVDVLSKVC